MSEEVFWTSTPRKTASLLNVHGIKQSPSSVKLSGEQAIKAFMNW